MVSKVVENMRKSEQPYNHKCVDCGEIVITTTHKCSYADEILCKKCKVKRRISDIKKNIGRYLSDYGVPPKYITASAENLQVDKYKKIISGYEDGGLFMWGGSGSGKTYVSVCIMKKLLEQGKNIIFRSVPQLLLEIKDTFNGQEYSDKELIEYYSRHDYLLLDDLGAEKCTDWVLQTLYMIIEYRDSHLKPTIITSNLSLDEIKHRLSDRIASRICGMAEIIHFNEEDLRIKLRKDK